MKTFMEKCVDGEASVEEVDEYLGLSPSEYALWGREDNGYLEQFLKVRKTGKIPFVFNS